MEKMPLPRSVIHDEGSPALYQLIRIRFRAAAKQRQRTGSSDDRLCMSSYLLLHDAVRDSGPLRWPSNQETLVMGKRCFWLLSLSREEDTTSTLGIKLVLAGLYSWLGAKSTLGATMWEIWTSLVVSCWS